MCPPSLLKLFATILVFQQKYFHLFLLVCPFFFKAIDGGSQSLKMFLCDVVAVVAFVVGVGSIQFSPVFTSDAFARIKK